MRCCKIPKQESSPINSPRPAPAGTSGHTKEKPDLTHSQDPHSGIGHADGVDWAPNSVGARCLWRHHVH